MGETLFKKFLVGLSIVDRQTLLESIVVCLPGLSVELQWSVQLHFYCPKLNGSADRVNPCPVGIYAFMP